MPKNQSLVRYGVIQEKNSREIVLLRGRGCAWRRCRFCDYHLDSSPDEAANFALNAAALNRVTGRYGRLEVVNSGSFVDLDETTMERIGEVCRNRGVSELHFECHWAHRAEIAPLKARFAALGVNVWVKLGVETFDRLFRESYLDKGIGEEDPAAMAAAGFGECCLLFGLPGQTPGSMLRDIALGLSHFRRVCVNVMQENSAPVKPAPRVIRAFMEEVFPLYRDDLRVDILLHNTDFGVGGTL